MSETPQNQLRDLLLRVDETRRVFAESALRDAKDEPSKHFADRAMQSFAKLGEDLRRYEFALAHCGSRGA